MNVQMIATFVVLALTVVVFIWDKFRVDVVAMFALLALVLTGIIDAGQALAGFSNSTVVMIAGLFVVGGGLFRTGVADWLGDQLLRVAGSSETRLIAVLMLGTALLSGFLSNTGTVAVLLPAVAAAAWRIRSMPSRLLLPLAFAASIGGMLTLIGTPPNIVIANTLRQSDLRPFSFFEFSLIGIPLLVVGVLYVLFVGQKWLPKRETRKKGREGGSSPAELAKAYHLEENLFRLRVRRRSDLVGKTLGDAFLGQDYGVTVVRIARAEQAEASPDGHNGPAPRRALETITTTFGMASEEDEETLQPGPETAIYIDDVLLVEGPPESVQQMAIELDLGIQPLEEEPDAHPEQELLSQEIGMAEILLTPRSALIGRTLADTRFGDKYNVQVLSIARRGKVMGDVPIAHLKLTFGDSLLVRGTWKSIGLMENESRNFVVVGQPSAMERPTQLSPQALVALAALAGMLVMMLTGVVSTVIAVLVTGMVMVVGGCLNMEQAYRAINWESVILIAAMLPMSTALEITGGAEFIANGLVNSLGVFHPMLMMAGVFILTTAFTQVISNTATTVLVAPIAIQAALNLGISPHPVLMMVAVGASAAFLTPIASPVNTLILTPGGYRFGDFMKIGLPLLLLFLVVSLLMVPLIWPM